MSDLTRFIIDLPPAHQAIWASCFHPRNHFFEFKKEEIEQSIPSRFEQRGRMYPERLALKARRC